GEKSAEEQQDESPVIEEDQGATKDVEEVVPLEDAKATQSNEISMETEEESSEASVSFVGLGQELEDRQIEEIRSAQMVHEGEVTDVVEGEVEVPSEETKVWKQQAERAKAVQREIEEEERRLQEVGQYRMREEENIKRLA